MGPVEYEGKKGFEFMTDATRRMSGLSLWADRIAPVALAVGAVMAAVGFVLTFTIAPLVNGASVGQGAVIGGVLVNNQLLLSQKIFYWHMPVAIVSMVALVGTLFYGIRFLMTRDGAYDLRAKLCTEISLVFILMTMCTGEMWERFEWGVWWTWEPRLTTFFILMLMVIGYFVLRNAIDDPERRAVFASVFGILTFVDVPICFLITRIIPSGVHPVIFRTDSGLSPEMLLPLMLSMCGFMLVAFGLYRLRLRTQLLEDGVARLQERMED